ncbi:MAG: TPM domain-containing protein [Marinifilaceae bacterium]|nr:TPM domain-containing protein [Marinifilaceae bacterium]
MSPEKKFTEEQKAAMVAAIQQAEKATSGEIRVHIENHCRKNVLDRAADVFAQLKMHKTAARNGVLVYVALEDRKLAILGDAGINAKVPANFWEGIKIRMVEQFKQGLITEGIREAVLSAGNALKTYFPYQTDDKNELPDDISFN